MWVPGLSNGQVALIKAIPVKCQFIIAFRRFFKKISKRIGNVEC